MKREKVRKNIRRYIRYKIKWLLAIIPFAKRITALIGFKWAYKKIFGNIKFQGQYFQDMIAYLYLNKKKTGFYVDIGAND